MSTYILLVSNLFQITLSFLIMGFFLSVFLISCLLWLQTLPPALTEHSLAANQTCCLGCRKCTVNFDLKDPQDSLCSLIYFVDEMHVLPCNFCNLFFPCSCCGGYKLCKFTALINEFSHDSCNSLSSCVCNYVLHSLSHTRFTLFHQLCTLCAECTSKQRTVCTRVNWVYSFEFTLS